MLLLLLLSRFSPVQLCEIPQTAGYQAPPSLGFSRREHWSGLPFSSPTRESEKRMKLISHVRLFATSWTITHQAPSSWWKWKREWKSWLKAQHSETEDHGIQSHHFMGIRWGNSGNCQTLFLGGSKITADGDCSHEIQRNLLLGRKGST